MRLAQIALALALLVWAAAWWRTRALPPPEQVRPELLQEPRQGRTQRERFSFAYRGLQYEVQPVASYDLYGLVVSHNDIHGIADIYHDEDSVDTKDLCVIWGANLERYDYLRITFENTPTWCHWSWRSDEIRFDSTAIANNHLVTGSDALRAALERVHVGDQVRFTGVLANYRDLRHPEYWRPTSTSRTDSGGGACEVVFFESFEVLKANAAAAWQVRRAMPWLTGALLALILVVAGTASQRRGEVRV
ncbi:MAG: hypothetical protein ACT4PK_04430 [Gammaproteobacteria bacterium]